ncbi:MAG: Na+/H+ antiporter subunit E [Planctomycetota bacterium]
MIVRLLLNCAMALVWMLLTQSVSFLNGLLGFVVSALVIGLSARVLTGESRRADHVTQRPAQRTNYLLRLVNVIRFAVYFLYILIRANLDVAWEIITPGFRMKPRMIRYDVAGLTPVQVTTLANAITLTPGTLSADVDDAGQSLYIHAMYAEHRQDAVDQLDELRRRLMWLVFGLRPDATEPQMDSTTTPTL